MDWIWTGKYNVGWTLLELLHLKLGGIWYMCGLLFLKKTRYKRRPSQHTRTHSYKCKKKNILYFYEHHRNTGSAYLRNQSYC